MYSCAQAANNLIVLARESAGAEKIFASNGVANLVKLIDNERDKQLQLTAFRVLSCLANDHHDRVSFYVVFGQKKVI